MEDTREYLAVTVRAGKTWPKCLRIKGAGDLCYTGKKGVCDSLLAGVKIYSYERRRRRPTEASFGQVSCL